MIARMDKSQPFKVSKGQQAQIELFVDRWKPLLFLHEWRIVVEYSDLNDPINDHVAAKTSADCTYKAAFITVYPCFFDNDATFREHIIVHELIHCITIIMKEPAYNALVQEKHVTWFQYKEADERCTQQITNVVFELYRQRKTIQ